MAGSLYLGSQKVCPAVVVGGGSKECARYVVNNGVATERTTLTGNEFKDITSIGRAGFCYAFYWATSLSGNLDLSNVESIGEEGMYNAFYQCFNLTSVDLSSLKSVDMQGLYCAFSKCTKLISADLSSLKSVSYGDDFYSFSDGCFEIFCDCYNLKSVDLSSLENAGIQSFFQAFKSTSLETIRFQSLKNIKNDAFSGAFINCYDLTDIYFNSLTTQSFSGIYVFEGMFDGRSAGGSFGSEVVTVHFPSNLQSSVEGLYGYPTFGGNSNSVILEFDLPATS